MLIGADAVADAFGSAKRSFASLCPKAWASVTPEDRPELEALCGFALHSILLVEACRQCVALHSLHSPFPLAAPA